MRLPFEDWLIEQVIPLPAKELFKEAVVCYKASAYRAALLFSYLGFQTTVRDRILRSKQPSSFTENHWKKIQNDVRDDDTWDNAVFDAIQQGPPREVFLLTEDLRNQVKYFKNRRNDCAHGKNNKIEYAHVEAFWLFIQSNLSRFVVNESREDLINRIRDHFDLSITPPGEDYSHIVNDIPYAVEQDRFIDFFHDVHQVFATRKFTAFGAPLEEAEFLNSILDLQEDVSSTKLSEYLQVKENEDVFVTFLKVRPERVVYFRTNPTLIRRLWYELLFTGYVNEKDLPVFCALLRNNLIPDTQIAEAFEVVIRKLRGQIPTQSCREILESQGFFSIFKELAFQKKLIHLFGWANSNRELI